MPVKLLDLTLPTPAENLACDEALLDHCEATHEADDILRFWEPQEPFVVVGYGNHAATEARLDVCHELSIPVLRRCSGGGAVVQGPGCLNYSLILDVEGMDSLKSVSGANRSIMQRHCDALNAAMQEAGLGGPRIEVRGHTDLAVGDLKFSGNSQRRRKRFLLFHGTFLLSMNLGLVDQFLPMPSKQPAYRAERSHADFLMHLPLEPDAVRSALQEAWHAFNHVDEIPSEKIAALAAERYESDSWNLRW
ncbi:MAG: lipoate--protein ligase family protein [Verrucomicrobiota bacterium]